MTDHEIETYFQYHNENIKLLKIGYNHIRQQIKDLYRSKKNNDYIFLLPETDKIKTQSRRVEKSLSRILSGIQVSWAEESIKRLLYEKNLLSDAQRDYIITRPALDQKWYSSLKIIFSIAYDLVPDDDEICDTVNINSQRNNLGNELVDQYLVLRSIITNNITPNFSIRNKVQHGEWEYAFNGRCSQEFGQDITDKLNNENIVTTTSRYILVNAFYQMMVDLGRFKSDGFALDSGQTPFEYFYTSYHRKIKFEVLKISNSEIDKFINEIATKEKRGEDYRNK